jgi:HK97 gp10 family phage protein
LTQAFLEGVTLDTTLLDKLIAETAPKASRVVQDYGFKIASEAVQGAPVDTGALRNSITSESRLEQPLLFIVRDGVEYGVFVEFGTSRQAARPFMIPAIENNKEKFLDAFRDILKV